MGKAGSPAWNRRSWSLKPYAGRTVAALSLGFRSDTAVEEYTVHIGALGLRRKGGQEAPPKPRGFTVDGTNLGAGVATAYLSWKLAHEGVWYYDLFRLPPGTEAGRSNGAAGVPAPEAANGKATDKEWIGRIFADAYVVPGLQRRGSENDTCLELVRRRLAHRRGEPNAGPEPAGQECRC